MAVIAGNGGPFPGEQRLELKGLGHRNWGVILPLLTLSLSWGSRAECLPHICPRCLPILPFLFRNLAMSQFIGDLTVVGSVFQGPG